MATQIPERTVDFVTPEAITSDVPNFNWSNAVHRIWHVKYEGQWYRASGERNAAGGVLVNLKEPLTVDQVNAECRKYNLSTLNKSAF